VDCLPLIAISIMSKKIASGADRVVLDVKVGSGALLPELGRARELAEWMVSLGKEFHRPTTAVLSNMDQPLGRQVGNALEVKEAIETLRGEGPADLTALSLELGSQMLLVSGVVTDAESGRKQLAQLLKVGAGLDKLKEIIANQSGDPAVVDDLSLLPRTHDRVVIPASTAGFVQMIDARTIGWASQLLGAGRLRMEDSVDLAVGITLNKKVGDPVVAGEPLAVLHFNNPERLVEVSDQVSRAFLIGALPPTNSPLIYEIIS
jgi:thymidine phosphorylase